MITSDILSLIVRVSLLLGVGFLVGRIAAKKSATLAHRTLVMTLGCALALPLIEMIMPGWKWDSPVPMTWLPTDIKSDLSNTARNDLRAMSPMAEAPSAENGADERSLPFGLNSPLAQSFEANASVLPAVREADEFPTAISARVIVESSSSPENTDGIDSSTDAARSSVWTWTEFGSAAWLIGACVLLGRLSLGLWRLSAFFRSCSPASVEVTEQVKTVSEEVGLVRRITIVQSGRNAMPMACWLGRSVIVLPSSFSEWSLSLQESTLIHELGHVARRDAWSDMFVQICLCLLWPNPITWLAARDVRRLRERACDEWVLQKSRVDVRVYAQSLIEVIGRCQAPPLKFASTMASMKDFESRLRWVVSAQRPRLPRPFVTGFSMLTVAFLGLAIATAKPASPQSAVNQVTDESVTRDSVVATNPASELNTVVVTKDPSPADPAISVAGVVTDTEGKPLAGMHVVLRAMLPSNHQYAWAIRHNRDVLARTTTNKEGRFAFSRIGIPPRMTEPLDSLRGGKPGAQLVVWGDGKAVAWQPIGSFQNPDQQIALSAEADVFGTVVDAKGNLVDGAELTISGFTKNTTNRDDFLSGPGDLSLYSSEITFSAIAQGGRFRILNMPRDFGVLFACTSQQGMRTFGMIDTSQSSFDTSKFRIGSRDEVVVLRTPAEVVMKQQPWIRIRVVDHKGIPVSGGGIEAVDSQRHFGGDAQVDANGIAVLRVNEPGVHQIHYGSDPLTPAVGLVQEVDIQAAESPVVEMRLMPTRTLTGKVIDCESGKPIVGACVQGGSSSSDENVLPRSTFAMAVTGADGVFKLPVVAGECVLTIRHDIDGYLAKLPRRVSTEPPADETRVTVPVEGDPEEVVIRIGRGLIIRGTVTDSEGRPVANAEVLAENDKQPYRRAKTITDKDGRYEFRGFSPYVATHLSSWTSAGTASDEISAERKHPWPETLTKTLDLQLSRGTRVKGRVVKKGKPVPGITVSLNASPAGPEGRYRLRSQTTTDDTGTYELVGLRKGERYQLEVDAPGMGEARDWSYQSPYSHTNNSDDGSTIEVPDAVLMNNGQSLSGIVVDPDGNPVPGITVSARLASGGNISRPKDDNAQPPWTDTDSEGRFQLTGLPEEQISLMAYRANPAGGRIVYPATLKVDQNATDIRILFDPKLGSDVEDLDAK